MAYEFKDATGSDIRPKQHFQVWAKAKLITDPIATILGEGTATTDAKQIGDFKSVSGIEMDTEVIEWKCGNYNSMLKLPGVTKFPVVVLSRGFDEKNILKAWYDLVWGMDDGGAIEYRAEWLQIRIYNRNYKTSAVDVGTNSNTGARFKTIEFKSPWVSKYSADDLDGQSSDPWLEKAEIAHNGWSYV